MNYNVHSFVQFEERLELIMSLLGRRRWDAVIFTETWRSEIREIFVTEYGHRWFGSGGTHGAKGVAVLLHKRWTYRFRCHYQNECAHGMSKWEQAC